MDARGHIRRRTALRQAGVLAAAVAALEAAGPLAFLPQRALAATTPSDIQFDIAAFLSSPPQTFGSGVEFQLPPVHTIFLTAALQRTPAKADRVELDRVLAALEAAYPWGAANLVTFVSYGVPYFSRLPGGLHGSLVSGHMPRLLSDHSQYVLADAVPGPTDVSPANPHIHKLRFNVGVSIEHNDLLFTLRSDNAAFLTDVLAWLGGSGTLRGQAVASPAWAGLLSFTSSRHMFVQMGLPKSIAKRHGLPFADFIQHQSPMWLGFADQQVNGSGPAPICTFAGNPSSRLTSATAGDYFDHGAIQHLSHLILDMLQFFAMKTPASKPGTDGEFIQRVQYAFHAPNLVPGNSDQFTDGGGPALLPNQNRGPHYAEKTAEGIGTNNGEQRMGHLSCLQRSSRATDGTPIHLRMDGPGFDNMDVPGGASQPKLQFTIFVPTAQFFKTLRISQASLDLQNEFGVDPTANGLERFITATRRQNYLIPPRRHRAFPLIELT